MSANQDQWKSPWALTGYVSPRYRAGHLSNAASTSRAMELYRETVAKMPFLERIKFKLEARFYHPVRGRFMERATDSLHRWWLWNVADSECEGLMARAYRILVKPETRTLCRATRRIQDSLKLRGEIMANLTAEGVEIFSENGHPTY
ncbi:hypothetical protein SAMN05444166_4194 [Singulisphaera sp. GP187]|uniref:hypothetical protein n=1 Tax=Singulisphaera sp. GP187 TaxID=1882752 RepID=UPI0009288DAA|nr:hypothetical protein [Singulisphaera sp. GP187]SIO37475.1 hypothetical protein SAMN05444166_4194 [Singulisphaera sp. GP187]